MAQLIVRDIDSELVRLLKIQAAQNNRSAEAEHRLILAQALRPESSAESFDAFLRTMPDVGEDEDFARIRDLGRRIDL